MLRYVAAWVPMVGIAVANGAVRELWYGKHVPKLRAHQISTGAGLVLLGVYMWSVLRIWPPDSTAQASEIGLAWLLLTIGFEFAFGRLAARRSWRDLLRDYDVLAGRVWVLVPIWVAIAPYAFFQTQR